MTKRELFTRVLVDAGPLVAIINERDQYHDECLEIVQQIVPPLLTSWLVVDEAAYLLRASMTSVERLLAGPASRLYRILPLEESELPQMAALVRKYRNLRPQLADISLVHLAGRESLRTVFTVDRRDFSVYRTAAGKSLHLLPETL